MDDKEIAKELIQTTRSFGNTSLKTMKCSVTKSNYSYKYLTWKVPKDCQHGCFK